VTELGVYIFGRVGDKFFITLSSQFKNSHYIMENWGNVND